MTKQIEAAQRNFMRALARADASEGEAGTPITFIATTAGMKRDGLSLKMENVDSENYENNPVILWAHDYGGRTLPIGKTLSLNKGKDEITAEVVFDQSDEFARSVEQKYRDGYLNAVSIGWFDKDEDGKRYGFFNPPEEDDEVFHELLDISAVPVPGDPDALMEREMRALQAHFEEHAELVQEQELIVPFKDNAHVPAEFVETWPEENVREINTVDQMVSYEENGNIIYTIPHHLLTGELVWRGLAAGMADLLSPACSIPEAERRGVYNHLKRHYRQIGKQPPEFMELARLEALGDEEWIGQFFEDEETYLPDYRIENVDLESLIDQYRELGAVIEERLEGLDLPAEDDEAEELKRIIENLDAIPQLNKEDKHD